MPISLVREEGRLSDNLRDLELYADAPPLFPPEPEPSSHASAYIAAVITRFGVAPLRSQAEFEALQRAQDRARERQEPAMLVGIPTNIDPAAKPGGDTWLDCAGIARSGDLALFDLRRVEVEPLERAAR
jgi:hypothetical protein